MSINSFGGLKDAILKWLLRDATDLVVTQEMLATYIMLCEAELNRELRVREREQDESYSTVAGQNYLELPDDFWGIITFSHDSRPLGMEYMSRDQLKTRYADATGRPEAFTIFGGKIILAPIPDAVYSMTLDYFKAIPGLSDTVTENDVLTRFPDAYLNCSLKNALTQLVDTTRLEIIAPIYGTIIERIKEHDKTSRIPEGTRMLPTSNRIIP